MRSKRLRCGRRALARLLGGALLVSGLAPRAAKAELELSRLVASAGTAKGAADEAVLTHLQRLSDSNAFLVRLDGGSLPSGATRLSAHYGVAPLSLGASSTRWLWSPKRRLLLDRAADALELAAFRRALAETQEAPAGGGSGAIVGLVDSGVDLRHPDLQTPGGESRVTWWLDFSLAPLGIYPELEGGLGCTTAGRLCAVLGPPEIAELARSGVFERDGQRVMVPPDRSGHGTHIASLAAGGGELYRGVAPEAELIVARVAGSDAAVTDLDVLAATRFIFDRAAAAGKPAVVNLSLGGDFGPHDGSSSIGKALLELTEEAPGRVIVVAAGNSGELVDDGSHAALGIHAQVFVPRGEEIHIPLVTPSDPAQGQAAFFVWVSPASPSGFELALDASEGEPLLPFQGAEDVRSVEATTRDGVAEFSVLNQVSDVELDGIARGAAVIGSGALRASSTYVLRLRGATLVDLWVQSEGTWSPYAGSRGALFPGATREGTINVPADAAELIAVGATWNRAAWPAEDANGTTAVLFAGQELDPALVGLSTSFSSAGPAALGALKPDLVAPGAAIVGALSQQARPLSIARENRESLFFASPICWGPDTAAAVPLDCAVVDGYHAAAAGTSMAAPLVAGVAALLLERDPSLTQATVRALLMAGASRVREPGSLVGAGQVNALGALRALDRRDLERSPTPSEKHSYLAFADRYVAPGGPVPLRVLAKVRDAADTPVALAALEDLEVRVTHGRVLDRAATAPGLIEMSLQAHVAAGGQVLNVELWSGSRLLAQGSVPVAADRNIALLDVFASGGCAFSLRAPAAPVLPAWLVFAWCLWRRRLRKSLASRARALVDAG